MRHLRALRAAFDKPTTLALVGGVAFPAGVGATLGFGAGLITFGLECIAAAVLSTTTRR